MKIGTFYLLVGVLLSMVGCGTMTGIPSHGGGKRFAHEQVLVNASAREALKSMPIEQIRGKQVALVFSVTGDQGSGNLDGGRLSTVGSFAGNLSGYSRNWHDWGNWAGDVSEQRYSSSAIQLLAGKPTPESYTNGVTYNGGDAAHLNNLLVSYLLRNGVSIVDRAEKTKPDAYVEVLVDVFGTVRDRTDWLFSNNERLVAVTSFELVITPAKSGIEPLTKRIGFEAEYMESYSFWIGPFDKTLKVSEYRYNKDLGDMGAPLGHAGERSGQGAFEKHVPGTVIVPSMQ